MFNHNRALPVFRLDSSNVSVSLPQAAGGCFGALKSLARKSFGRMPPVTIVNADRTAEQRINLKRLTYWKR
jgi:hypothetical protein